MNALEPGNVVLGRYRIAHSLGAGGMGVVYLAERIADGTKVVIKTVHDHLADEPEMRARFLREAEATRALRHPHIVDVIEASADPLLMVLEHLPGRSLQDRLREGPLPEAEVISIALQLLDALDAAHRAKLIHRDLKPGNVMVLEGVRVKLLDFGISRMVDAARHTKLTQTGQILGTPGYLAPEQALARTVDARTDLYSLGVLMFRALTGRLPFDGRAASLLRAVVEDEPHPLPKLRPNVDPGLASVVHRALQKDPAFRFQSAREMRDALRGGPRRSRWMLVAAIAGVLTAVATIGVLAIVQPGAEPEPLALRPVAPIVSDAHVPEVVLEDASASEEATSESEPIEETMGEMRARAPVRMRRAAEREEPFDPFARTRRGRFDVEFSSRHRVLLEHWWRSGQTILRGCFFSMPAFSRTWVVRFDAVGEVMALSVGGANLVVSSCALHAFDNHRVPPPLRDQEVRFRVAWTPG